MSFDDLLRGKIAARRGAPSAAAQAEALLRQRALDRIRPLHEAVVGMVERLGRNPVFAKAAGARPEVVLGPVDLELHAAFLSFQGTTGIFRFTVHHPNRHGDVLGDAHIEFGIDPDLAIRRALQCGLSYAETIPVRGTMADVPGFIVAVEDMIAEYLADLCASPLGDKFLPDDL